MAQHTPRVAPPSATVPVLVTYTDAQGHQLPLLQAQMRESFTGLQLLARHVLGVERKVLEGYTQDFTVMQMGPSALEIEIRAIPVRQNRLRGRAALKRHLRTVGVLDRFTDVLISLGELACFIARHPAAEVRFVSGCYGDYYEFLDGGRVVLAMEAPSVERLLEPDSVQIMRVILANQKQPGVAYCTLSKRILGVEHMRRTIVPANEHLRAFADGAPLHITRETLEVARARADPERNVGRDVAPATSNTQAMWDQL